MLQRSPACTLQAAAIIQKKIASFDRYPVTCQASIRTIIQKKIARLASSSRPLSPSSASIIQKKIASRQPYHHRQLLPPLCGHNSKENSKFPRMLAIARPSLSMLAIIQKKIASRRWCSTVCASTSSVHNSKENSKLDFGEHRHRL